MKKQTVIDQVEIKADGVVQVRFFKQVIDDDGTVLSQDFHRTSIMPGQDVDAQMVAVNNHLVSMKCAPVLDHSQLKAHATLAHTPEVVAAFKAKQKAAQDTMVNQGR